MLLGRDRERREIERALDRARRGESAVLALVGEPGIGKSALLAHAAEQAGGMRRLHARGVESEAHIPFAALFELLRPALEMLDAVPEPQARALEAALALRPGHAEERFAIGAATLSLLAAYAERGPLAVLVDDAQWLDDASAQALRFAFRRLMADPIAVLLAVREGEPSLLDGADLPALHLEGLGAEDAAALLEGVPPELAARLHRATAGNPLALLELAGDPEDLALAPEDAPVLVSARVARAFVHRMYGLDGPARRALVLAAASGSGELALLARAAAQLGTDLSALEAGERAGLVSLRAGTVEFRHPLARSGVYAEAPAAERRAAHRALAAVLPDRDVDRRAWHLAAAATGPDPAAAAALAQAGARSRERSAYGSAAAAFERAARLSVDGADLLRQAGEAAWLAGEAERALALLEEARAEPALRLEVDQLAGHIATRRGPVMRGHAILVAAAADAPPAQAVEMLAEAASACFYAGAARELLAVAERARALVPPGAGERTRFLAAMAVGMARVIGGDAAAGAAAVREAADLAAGSPALRRDLGLLSWQAVAPLILREADTARPLLTEALSTARARSALGVLPFVLNMSARDAATADRWAVAAATYQEAIERARESGQRVDLVFSLSGLAWLQARRGREAECRALAAETLALCEALGTRLQELWAIAAVGELELALGNAGRAAESFERQHALMRELAITDPDISPAPELVDAYLRLGRTADAERVADEFAAAAHAKAQPWSLARAERCAGLLADDAAMPEAFVRALRHHAETPDGFEAARTRLAYGERLRRARNRVRAREQLRAAVEAFERLEARPWAERARAELEATGERLRRRGGATADALTPQELQIALLLAEGRTTREAAAALFLSPKTIEYHLRHVYLKLGVNSRDALMGALGPSLHRQPEGREEGEPERHQGEQRGGGHRTHG